MIWREMMQVALDMLRGFLAFVLIFAAAAAIVYFVVPGMEYSADRAVQRVARLRSMTAMFGGAGLLMMAIFLTIGIISAIRR
jgi:hypothetical protein